MAHFVSKDEEEFVVSEVLQGCIPEHNASRAEQAGDVGVVQLGVQAQVGYINAAAFDAGARGLGKDFGFERFVRQRPKLMEERVNQDGLDEILSRQKQRHQQTQPEPPAARAFIEDKKRNPAQRQTNDHRHRRALEGVAQPAAEDLIGQIVVVGKDKAGVKVQRQVDEEIEQAKGQGV